MSGIYYPLFDMLVEFVWGNSAALDNYQYVVMTLVCTIACLAVIALPFVIVWRIIKLFV